MNIQELLFLTPKSNYYDKKKDILEGNQQIHQSFFEENRELYTCLLYLDNMTYYSKALIIKNILKNSLYKEENKINKEQILLEDALIKYCLYNENITHALKMLLYLKENRVNNSRTTKIILDFLFNRKNLDFICIKYKNKIKQLLIHCLGLKNINKILSQDKDSKKIYNKYFRVYDLEKYEIEQSTFCFEFIFFVFNIEHKYTNECFLEYFEVRNNVIENKPIKETFLPIEVVKGFYSFYKKYPIRNIDVIGKTNISDKQKIQMQNTIKKENNGLLKLNINYSKYDLLDLIKYLYNSVTLNERSEINNILKEKYIQYSKDIELNKEKTAIIVDYSDSQSGSQESLNHNFFKTLILKNIIIEYFSNNNITFREYIVGSKINEDGLLIPYGETCLYKPLIQGIKDGFSNFIIISDGYNNIGNFEEVYHALTKIRDIKITHFNPNFSAKNKEMKKLANNIQPIAFKDEYDLKNLRLYYMLNEDPQKFINIVKDNILRGNI